MKAATTLRRLLPARASALRWNCSGSRCRIGGQDPGHSRIADCQLHAREAAADWIGEKRHPERLGPESPKRHARHFTAAVGVHAHGNRHGNGDDPTSLAQLEICRVDPEAGPFALDRAGEESIDPFVDLFAEPADLAPGRRMARDAYGLWSSRIPAGRCVTVIPAVAAMVVMAASA